MRPRRAAEGYVLLAALAVVAASAVTAVVAVAAVTAVQRVTAADRCARRARSAAAEGLERAQLALVARGAASSGEIAASAVADGPGWAASWMPAAAESGWASSDVRASSQWRGARAAVRAVVELRAPPWLCGVSVGGDVLVHGAITLQGCGLCAGGSVRGRDRVSVAGDGLDAVHGDVWPAAACHAGGRIWSAEGEIHAAAPCLWPSDTDADLEPGPVADYTDGPSEAELALVEDGAVSPGAALQDGGLDVEALPAYRAGGLVVEARGAYDEPLRLTGRRSAEDSPLTVVVHGDCVVEAAGAEWTGALLVEGALVVAGEARLTGHVWARSLQVEAPLTVVVPGGWRCALPPGTAWPRVVALGEG